MEFKNHDLTAAVDLAGVHIDDPETILCQDEQWDGMAACVVGPQLVATPRC